MRWKVAMKGRKGPLTTHPEKHLLVWGQQCPGPLPAARGMGKESKGKGKGRYLPWVFSENKKCSLVHSQLSTAVSKCAKEGKVYGEG